MSEEKSERTIEDIVKDMDETVEEMGALGLALISYEDIYTLLQEYKKLAKTDK